MLDLEQFSSYLRDNNCEILSNTNPFEVLRYRRKDFETIVIYQNKQGTWRIPPTAYKHIELFRDDKPITRHRRAGSNHKKKLVQQLRKRDGHFCCYCDRYMEKDEQTLEHFLPISRGGTNDPYNCALAHEECNRLADSLPIMEKLRLRKKLTLSFFRDLESRFEHHKKEQ